MSLVNTETGEVVQPCSEAEARALTDSIRSTADSLWALLLEAHERRAWAALGYGSFVDYAHAEFDMAKSHAYRILDQGRVIREIEAVVAEVVDTDSPDGESEPAPVIQISEAEARDIKPVIEEVAEEIRETLTAEPAPTPERVQEVVRETVQKARNQALVIPKSGGTLAFDALLKVSKAAKEFMEQATVERLQALEPDEWESFQHLAERLGECTSRITTAGRQRRQLRAITGGNK